MSECRYDTKEFELRIDHYSLNVKNRGSKPSQLISELSDAGKARTRISRIHVYLFDPGNKMVLGVLCSENTTKINDKIINFIKY